MVQFQLKPPTPPSPSSPEVGNFFLSGLVLGVGGRANRSVNDYSCKDLTLFKCDTMTV